MASRRNGTIYVGVSSDLVKRVHQHRNAIMSGFASKHGCTSPVYYELHEDMTTAIAREKQIKGGSRARKLALIEAGNPTWRDLYLDIL
jgi:predicted GIY-YIG superfamily endonuclease